MSNSDFEDAPTLATGDRVLVKNQPPDGPVKDGVYVIGESTFRDLGDAIAALVRSKTPE